MRSDLGGEPAARRWERAQKQTRINEVVRQAEQMYVDHAGVQFTWDKVIPGVIAFQIINVPEPAVNSLGAVGPELRSVAEVNSAIRAIHERGLPVLGRYH